MIKDPTRNISIQPAFYEVDSKPQKISFWGKVRRFFDSDFMFYVIIFLLRALEITLILGSLYIGCFGFNW